MTISLTINDIPDFLKNSELYKNIVSNQSFDVPIELFKKEIIIHNFNDLIEYIKIFDYWMINKIPKEFYDCVFKNKDKINIDLLNDQFPMNDLIKQIHIIINTTNDKLCDKAAKNGLLDLLKYAHGNGYKWHGEFTCSFAVFNGHLECLKYLYENGCEWDKNMICADSVLNGHLECLKYLHENGCILDELTCSTAVINGHLDCLKYLHENGCPWDELTCSNAAEYGHLDCLKYAHDNGCPCIAKLTCSNATRNGHLDCLNYALENGCIWDGLICDNVRCDEDLERLRKEEHKINV